MVEQTTNNQEVQLSVVMVVHDDDVILEQNLPLFLSQECEIPYEVIVVDDASSDGTPDILKNMKEQYPHLRTTFFPQSVPNPSRIQLALYVGIKAAKSNNIVIADINRPPVSAGCIDGLAEALKGNEVALVYTDRKRTEVSAFQSFFSLEDAASIIRKAERRSGKGHNAHRMKKKKGVYDAIAICRERVFEAIRLYDQSVKGAALLGLRLKVFFENITL